MQKSDRLHFNIRSAMKPPAMRPSAMKDLFLLSVLLLTPLTRATADTARERPNIVFVLFDDMGWGQPQSYVAESALRTPNLDRLAQQGMRFTHAHSAAAVCTPTRYGVLTTFSRPIIPESRLTVASLLQQQGYATACVGKWHLGLNWVDGKPGSEKVVPLGAKMTGGPNALGFDYFYGFTHARGHDAPVCSRRSGDQAGRLEVDLL
jgi:arylsulfatase A-like enzyme